MRIFVGLLAGIAIGALARLAGLDWLMHAVVAAEPLGTIFIRLITMVVVPLVIASLFVGIASLGDVRRLGRIGGKTLVYFGITTVLAATIGLGAASIVNPGRDPNGGLPGPTTPPASSAPDVRGTGLMQTIVDMTPQNPFAAAAAGDLLPLIVAVCIFAAAATVTRGVARDSVLLFFEGVNEVAMVVIRWLMWLAPGGVLVLIAGTVARSGLNLLASLLTYGLVVVAALAIHVAVVLLPMLRFGARLGVVCFFRSVADALLLAFSTASSSATLPVSMAAAKNRLGISNEIASFVLPLGTTLDKNGAAAYKAVTAVFLAHVYGVTLGAGQLVTIVLTSTAAAFAGAGVPGSSLVTTLIVLNGIGLGANAAAGIALVAAIDRPLDMCRTTVNTIGNLVGAAWVSRSEGEMPTATLPT